MNRNDIASYLNHMRGSLDAVSRLNFSSWLEGHVATSPVSSNIPSQNLPFQRWYRFKEAFSPLLVLEALDCLDFWPSTCLDCFGGSGTTALTCQFLGIAPTTIEVNPFLADLIEAKLARYNVALLIDDYCAVLDAAQQQKIDMREFRGAEWPETLIEPGVGGRWIYGRETFRRLLALRNTIEGVTNTNNRRLLKVLLGSILVEVSNVCISGKGRRYRKNWQNSQKTPNDVDAAFRRAFNTAIADITAHNNRKCSGYKVIRNDARSAISSEHLIDVALFSPPYPNSFDYTDIYNLELWVLGYLQTRKDNQALRSATLRSHVQVSRDFSWEHLRSSKLSRIVNKLRRARDQLWDSKIPDMVGAYFADLDQVLRSIRKNINPNGAVLITIGDSRYANVLVDVGEILKELAPSAGYVCESITPIRSMRTSAQQGWRSALSEELVRLRPV